MRILGIDPGSRATGFGFIDCDGPRLTAHRWGRLTSKPTLPLAERLLIFFEGLEALVADERPEVAAIESVFYARNARSALILGHARGVAVLAAARAGIPVVEYSPLEIKQAVVGYGRGEKAQVQAMVTMLLRLDKKPPHDAADALAVAICHAHSSTLQAKLHSGRAQSRLGA